MSKSSAMSKTKNRIQQGLKKFSNEQLFYVKSLVKSPVEIGQVTPSSRFLADAMVSNVDLKTAKLVVEFGPGTGSVTRSILEKCGPQTNFFTMETNANMISILRRRFPDIRIVHDSAEFIGNYLKDYGVNEVDYIISSLPFALLEPDLGQRILENANKALRPGGVFVTYQYVHARLLNSVTRKLRRNFQTVESSVCFRNLPPAFVFQCLK